MADLLELAARCEAATGADGELDGCIWWASLSPDQVEHFDRTGFVRRCIERDGSAGTALAQFFDSANPTCLARIAFEQRCTASLDAAMTLVPERLHPGVSENIWHLHWHAWMGRQDRSGMPDDVANANAATPALALCAAALRARAALASGVSKEKENE